MVNAHELAEERSIALHRAILERLRADPRLIDVARTRVHGWLDKSVPPQYARPWNDLLAGPFDRLFEVLLDRGEQARALRQCSPFAGVIDPPTRRRILREVRERLGRGSQLEHLIERRLSRRLEELPGGDMVRAGLRDLGLDVPQSAIPEPDMRLYQLLAEAPGARPDSAHSRYNAIIRRMVSFCRTLASLAYAQAGHR